MRARKLRRGHEPWEGFGGSGTWLAPTLCWSQSKPFPAKKHQRGETWVAIGLVDSWPRVGRSALRIMGCNKDPRIETRGGASVLSCEALSGVARLATNKFQSSVCCAKSISPEPEISPRRVCMLNIWDPKWPAPRGQSVIGETTKAS